MAATLDYNYIAKLVRLAQGGDSDAFAELYLATYQRLYAFSCRYLKDEYLAQDAVQETYIKALQHLNQVQDASLVVSWLGQINMRVCYRMQHRLSRTQTVSDESFDLIRPPDESTNPENEVVRIDYNDYLIRQLLNLPFTESQALLMRYYHNMKLEEIADMMDISVSTVKRSIKSGIARLKRTIKS